MPADLMSAAVAPADPSSPLLTSTASTTTMGRLHPSAALLDEAFAECVRDPPGCIDHTAEIFGAVARGSPVGWEALLLSALRSGVEPSDVHRTPVQGD